MRFRAITSKLYSSRLLQTSTSSSFSVVPPLLARRFHGSIIPQFQHNVLFPRVYMSTSSALLDEEPRGRRNIGLLKAVEDQHGGVIINMEEESMNSYVFASMLEASLSLWRKQVHFK